jgi:hypothetical protein
MRRTLSPAVVAHMLTNRTGKWGDRSGASGGYHALGEQLTAGVESTFRLLVLQSERGMSALVTSGTHRERRGDQLTGIDEEPLPTDIRYS